MVRHTSLENGNFEILSNTIGSLILFKLFMHFRLCRYFIFFWIRITQALILALWVVLCFVLFCFVYYRKIVDRIDSDGDSFVTTEELKTWIKRVQKRYIYDNVAKVWKDYDRDKDDKISWEEYKQATYGYYLGKRCCRGRCMAGARITCSLIIPMFSGRCYQLLSRTCLCSVFLCLLRMY